MAKVIDYYMTHSSPWTYMGHDRLAAIAKAAGATINVKPADYGKVFPASGGLPLKQRPLQRQAYRMMELKRWRAHLGLPFNLEPKFFPFEGTAASLLTVAAVSQGTDAAMLLSSAILRGCWEEEKNMADIDALVATADSVGLNGAELVALSKLPETAAAFERNSQEAIAAQVFGAPTYIYQGELYWGQDRLDFLQRALNH